MKQAEKTTVIDEDQVDTLCKRLEEGYITPEESARILGELELLIPAAREKTGSLRRLFSRKRIPDLSAWRIEVLRNTGALRMTAHVLSRSSRFLRLTSH
jgi:hypothetical protein